MRIDDVNIGPVERGGQHPRAEARLPRRPPAMQEDESRAVRVEQQVVEPVLGPFGIAGELAESHDIGQRYNQSCLPLSRSTRKMPASFGAGSCAWGSGKPAYP